LTGQLRQRRLGIRQDRYLGAIVLAELPGIGVEMDDGKPRWDRLDLGGQRHGEEIADDGE
jgi:hypothetical protein